jgi:AraC-like DNA-binding protein
VLFPDVAHLRPPGFGTGPRLVEVAAADLAAVGPLLRMVREETARPQPPTRRDRALRALRELLVLRLGLDRADGPGTADLPAPYLALRAELEARPVPARSVAELAAALGYSARTLSRACQRATGRTAKQIVDERTLLEARRLLSYTDRPASAVGRAVGFPDPTNLNRFFTRLCGRTPAAWRADNHLPAAPDG